MSYTYRYVFVDMHIQEAMALRRLQTLPPNASFAEIAMIWRQQEKDELKEVAKVEARIAEWMAKDEMKEEIKAEAKVEAKEDMKEESTAEAKEEMKFKLKEEHNDAEHNGLAPIVEPLRTSAGCIDISSGSESVDTLKDTEKDEVEDVHEEVGEDEKGLGGEGAIEYGTCMCCGIWRPLLTRDGVTKCMVCWSPASAVSAGSDDMPVPAAQSKRVRLTLAECFPPPAAPACDDEGRIWMAADESVLEEIEAGGVKQEVPKQSEPLLSLREQHEMDSDDDLSRFEPGAARRMQLEEELGVFGAQWELDQEDLAELAKMDKIRRELEEAHARQLKENEERRQRLKEQRFAEKKMEIERMEQELWADAEGKMKKRTIVRLQHVQQLVSIKTEARYRNGWPAKWCYKWSEHVVLLVWERLGWRVKRARLASGRDTCRWNRVDVLRDVLEETEEAFERWCVYEISLAGAQIARGMPGEASQKEKKEEGEEKEGDTRGPQ